MNCPCHNNTVVPCYNCVCVAVCRHKTYTNLYSECDLLQDYLRWSLSDERSQYNQYSVFTWVADILKPTQWSVDKNGDVCRKDMIK